MTKKLFLSTIISLITITSIVATSIIIFFGKDYILVAADSKVTYKDIFWRDSSFRIDECKIRKAGNYWVTFAGQVPRSFDVFQYLDSILTCQILDDALISIDDKFKEIQSIFAKERLRNYDEAFIALNANQSLSMMELAIIGFVKNKLTAFKLIFYYKKSSKFGEVKSHAFMFPNKVNTHTTLGENSVINKIINFDSIILNNPQKNLQSAIKNQAKESSSVGGKVNILRIEKNKCTWLSKTTCKLGF